MNDHKYKLERYIIGGERMTGLQLEIKELTPYKAGTRTQQEIGFNLAPSTYRIMQLRRKLKVKSEPTIRRKPWKRSEPFRERKPTDVSEPLVTSKPEDGSEPRIMRKPLKRSEPSWHLLNIILQLLTPKVGYLHNIRKT